MKYKCFLSILFLIIFNSGNAQEKKASVNPVHRLYFGVETGFNTIKSFKNDHQHSFYGGILTEYYFAKQFSVSGRLRFYKTGVSFFYPEIKTTSWVYTSNSDEVSGTFNGEVISVPVDFKWEFRLLGNLKANIKVGYALNFETKSEYVNYTPNISTDFSKVYGSFGYGAGLNFFISEKHAVFFNFENFKGASRADKSIGIGFLSDGKRYIKNDLFSLGYKFSLK